MDTQRRSSLVIGLLLLLVGGWFLAVQYVPALGDLIRVQFAWPLYVVGVGALFFVLSALAGAPDLAVPGTIIAGIGGILYYQNLTGDWASWAYAWALIPGFAGVGTIFQGLLEGNFGRALREGMGAIVTSLFLFGVFGSFLGGPRVLRDYWPALLIVVGVWMVVRGLTQRRGPTVIVEAKPEMSEADERV